MERIGDHGSRARERRRESLALAFEQVTTCERIQLTPTLSIPVVLADSLRPIAVPSRG